MLVFLFIYYAQSELFFSGEIEAHFWMWLTVFRGLDFSRPWHDAYVSHREGIREHLHLLHPSMQTVLNMCQSTLGNLILVDVSTYRYLLPHLFRLSSTCVGQLSAASLWWMFPHTATYFHIHADSSACVSQLFATSFWWMSQHAGTDSPFSADCRQCIISLNSLQAHFGGCHCIQVFSLTSMQTVFSYQSSL